MQTESSTVLLLTLTQPNATSVHLLRVGPLLSWSFTVCCAQICCMFYILRNIGVAKPVPPSFILAYVRSKNKIRAPMCILHGKAGIVTQLLFPQRYICIVGYTSLRRILIE